SKANAVTGVPTNALIAACFMAALFAALPFGKLVVVDIILYSAELLLEFIALMALRRNEPDLERPFRIRGGRAVLVLITILPMSFAVVVIWATLSDPEADIRHLVVVVAGLLSGVLLYLVRKNKAAALSEQGTNV
ncbi:MAG TPA: hypothetical protein VHQ01_03795, partial [Pyrinomonadaceae bacterium]|nr:hypothetical protein [Pyrinomonadaceae bacterium]